MKILKKLFITLGIISAVALIIGVLHLRQLSRKGLPGYNAEIKLGGMLDQATIKESPGA